ncbi:MAG: glycosyltransferase 87 family protein [Burkholderiaceae bacterium]|nr:glycosyltransferase 87 family protein [Burkholderiaceae bacterium]
MRLITCLSLLMTGLLVGVSYFGVKAQLFGLSAALLLGTVLMVMIFRLKDTKQLKIRHILFLAVALRVLACFALPILENDFYRYLWDAYRFATTGTPYGAAPTHYLFDANLPAAFREILGNINYPNIPTIYGPVTELWFLAGYGLAPAKVGALQVLNTLLDIGLIVLLARLGAQPRWLLLYAISPLILKESVMTAHPDLLVGMFAVASLVAAKRAHTAGGLMGLAIASKVAALVLLPFLVFRFGWRGLLWCGLTLACCYLPFMWQPGSEFFALQTFATVWRFNPLLFAVIEVVTRPEYARAIAGGLLALVLAWIAWREWQRQKKRVVVNLPKPTVPPADLALGALLAFAPVINPWYLLWFLPFAVLRPTRTAWAVSLVVPLSYWHGGNFAFAGGREFGVPILVTVIELLVLVFCFIWDRRKPLYPQKDALE